MCLDINPAQEPSNYFSSSACSVVLYLVFVPVSNFSTRENCYRINQWVSICLMKKTTNGETYLQRHALKDTENLLLIFFRVTCRISWSPFAVTFVCKATASVLIDKITTQMWVQFYWIILQWCGQDVVWATLQDHTPSDTKVIKQNMMMGSIWLQRKEMWSFWWRVALLLNFLKCANFCANV